MTITFLLGVGTWAKRVGTLKTNHRLQTIRTPLFRRRRNIHLVPRSDYRQPYFFSAPGTARSYKDFSTR